MSPRKYREVLWKEDRVGTKELPHIRRIMLPRGEHQSLCRRKTGDCNQRRWMVVLMGIRVLWTSSALMIQKVRSGIESGEEIEEGLGKYICKRLALFFWVEVFLGGGFQLINIMKYSAETCAQASSLL